MNETMFACDGRTYRRISKNKARELFTVMNDEIYICPCSLRPFSEWGTGCWISRECALNFETAVSLFEVYNCINRETGKYAAFYIEEKGENHEMYFL